MYVETDFENEFETLDYQFDYEEFAARFGEDTQILEFISGMPYGLDQFYRFELADQVINERQSRSVAQQLATVRQLRNAARQYTFSSNESSGLTFYHDSPLSAQAIFLRFVDAAVNFTFPQKVAFNEANRPSLRMGER